MSKKLSGKKVDINNKKFSLSLIPLLIVMGILPLLVYYYSFNPYLSKMSWYTDSEQAEDFFNFYRGLLLFAMVICMAVLIAVKVKNEGKKSLEKHKFMVPLGVYAAFIVLSTIMSPYIYYSIFGIEHHFETVYVLLSYCALVIFSYWLVKTERDVKYIMYAWFVAIAGMGILGLFQLAGADLYGTDFGEALILPAKIRKASDIVFKFEEGMVYLTMYNPNYVGFVATLSVPVLTVFFVFSEKKLLKIISIVLNSVMVLCLMGSGARNGMIALFVAMVFMLVIFRKKLKNYWKWFAIAYASMLAIFFVFNAVNGGMVAERLEKGLSVKKDIDYSLENIETNKENVTIAYEGNRLVITAEYVEEDKELKINLVDGDGGAVAYEKQNIDKVPTYKITDERFPFEIQVGGVEDYLGFVVEIEGEQWPFTNMTEYEGYFFFTPYGKATKIEKAETAIFTNYSTLASSRGYIWARTIPLLKDYLLIGSGPDTFSFVFPQRDYVEGSRYGFKEVVMTKPHNLYLQIATQTGVVSMVAFLTLNIIYLLECLKIYWKCHADGFMECIGMGIMTAVIGYLISGIINDSTVNIAPVYWCMLGVGFAINREIRGKVKNDIKR